MRHGERLDHINPEWARHASRPHDSPLSPEGHKQAHATGEWISGRLYEDLPLLVRTSPLVRCVQTAAGVTQGLGRPEFQIQIEPALCEDERHLRPRMMGTHKESIPAAEQIANGPTVEGTLRGVCRPVLLSPGDLLQAHDSIDVEYFGKVSAFCNVQYTECGEEIDGNSSEPRSALQRSEIIGGMIDDIAPPEHTTVLVTHGGVAAMVGNSLCPSPDWAALTYCEAVELELNENTWKVVAKWGPVLAETKPNRID